jgi:MFS superfamily sulfate permease-like transporter
MEWAGAFGDLGTLIPFFVAYIAIVKMDPLGVLSSFGISLLTVGVYYKTPFPVQPMKLIGAAAASQAAQTATITQNTVISAAFITGFLWLLLGLTGAAARIANWVPRYIVTGIVLGLGLGFMHDGIHLMSSAWPLAVVGLFGTLLLLTNKVIPAMFVLLIVGALYGIDQNPNLWPTLSSVRAHLRLPQMSISSISWHDILIGGAVLALPQLPLTLGNAVIAIREENNRLFPDRSVSEDAIATSTGLMNLISAVLGGVPMCHGAGGMAAHVAFGAKTGGAPIILGVILLLLACFFSDSIEVVFSVFPQSLLGVILFLTGIQLSLGSCDFAKNKQERFITLATAAFSMWNVGLAFVIGMMLGFIHRRGWLRL